MGFLRISIQFPCFVNILTGTLVVCLDCLLRLITSAFVSSHVSLEILFFAGYTELIYHTMT